METTGGPDREPTERATTDAADQDGREMPPEPAPSPGEKDREKLGQDVSEQAP